jgi:hypothetical protein
MKEFWARAYLIASYKVSNKDLFNWNNTPEMADVTVGPV